MKQTILGAALISVLILVTASVSVKAASLNSFKARELTFDVDHFKCYRPEFIDLKPIFGPVVELEDQFMTETVEVFTHLRLCNATGKRHGNVITENPHEKTHHLLLYHFNRDKDAKPIQGGVTVLNQFGQQNLKIQDARILAVPTQKNKIEANSSALPDFPPEPTPEEDLPDDLSHYKCYYATGTGPDPIPAVFLFDQFEQLSHQLLSPVLFCNPVKKTKLDDNGNILDTFPIVSKDHLTCYKLSIASEQPKFAQIFNQFIDGHIDVIARAGDILCVPSKKVAFDIHTVTETSDRDTGNQCTVPEDECSTNADCDGGQVCTSDCRCLSRTPPRN